MISHDHIEWRCRLDGPNGLLLHLFFYVSKCSDRVVLLSSLQIENYLLRNHETRKYLQEQAYRLQQGIVTSTTQKV